MGTGVTVVVETVDGSADVAVAQHAFGTVAEGDDSNTFAAHGDGGGKGVHLVVAEIGRDVMPQPRVEDAAAVDAMHQAEIAIDVKESVD